MLYASIRIIKADNEEEAIQKVIDGDFIESNELCDKVIPLKDIKLND